MVIGNDFVWAHMGKTGGDSVHSMFSLLSSKYIVYSDDVRSPDKHKTFKQRERDLSIDLTNSRKRILNFRRLPSWILSFTFHKIKHEGAELNYEQLLNGYVFDHFEMKDGIKTPIYVHADSILKFHISGRVDYWIRTEYLADDFISVCSKFVKLSLIKRFLIRRKVKNVNNDYAKDLRLHFSDQQLSQLYKSCPLWASIETDLYGSTLSPNITAK